MSYIHLLQYFSRSDKKKKRKPNRPLFARFLSAVRKQKQCVINYYRYITLVMKPERLKIRMYMLDLLKRVSLMSWCGKEEIWIPTLKEEGRKSTKKNKMKKEEGIDDNTTLYLLYELVQASPRSIARALSILKIDGRIKGRKKYSRNEQTDKRTYAVH